MRAIALILSMLCFATSRPAVAADQTSRPAQEAPPASDYASTNIAGQQWSEQAAAKYLDDREAWWLTWPQSQRDHATACVSCHTALPYALSRRALRSALHETAQSQVERDMLANVVRRVSLWNEVLPFYNEAQAGPNKTIESWGTEAVLNALILANYDVEAGKLSQVTRDAFKNLWALQLTSGEGSGGWNWLNFHNAPWEANESPYLGASLAAIAVGIAPENYKSEPAIGQNLGLLRRYLAANYESQPLLNQAMALWASGSLPGVLTPEQKRALEEHICHLQQSDGGWSLGALGTWAPRRDGTPVETQSDGYATGLVLLALQQSGMPRSHATVAKGLSWLARNQDRQQGLWNATSLNKKRDPTSDVGHFMTDAATAYAVMALKNAL